jgi:TolB-like protein/Flp pilus assembly protein TadD
MRRKPKRSVANLEALVVRRAARVRFVAYGLAGAAFVLVVINAATQSGTVGDASLAKRWWSLIPVLVFGAMAAILTARDLWLLPRELALRKWLRAARPLHEPLRQARLAEERILEKIEGQPDRDGLEDLCRLGQESLARMVEAPIDGDQAVELHRRAARIEAYRVALSTLEIDTLLKKDWVGSDAFRAGLEKAGELLEIAESEATGPEVGEMQAGPRYRSVAVLPFADLSPLGDQEHFSHGLAEELITSLTKIRGLRVIARGLAFSLAEQDLSVREIGRRLGVETILEGNVQRSGDRLAVTTQLTCVASGQELWSGNFDEELQDVFRIEKELINGVVSAIGVLPSTAEKRALEKPPTQVVGAYDFYLRGRRYFAQYHGRGMEFALDMFSRAIELDDQYALAYAGIADCSAFLYANSGRSPEHRERALAASAKALELDPELPEAHVSRGVALSQSGRPEEAGQYFETALRLNPRLFEAHYFYARHHFTAGDSEKAIEFYESAAELRPEDYQTPLLSAQIYDDVGRPEDGRAVRQRGVKVAEEHLKLNPDDARALYIGANGLVSLGQIEEGLRWARLARELQPNEPMALYNLACIYSLAGEVDAAIDCLSTSIEHGFSYRDWVEHDSNLDNIRNAPRFPELMTRL